jgi:hypothetical protein
MATTYSNNTTRIFRDILTVDDDLTLTAADSGKLIFMNAAGGGTLTLPALKAGVNFRIMVGATAPTTAWIVDSAEGDNISGNLTVNGASVPAVAEDQINFIANTALPGDYIDLECDGTNWYVLGVGNAAGAITATDPS